jgi:hypothetical protein
MATTRIVRSSHANLGARGGWAARAALCLFAVVSLLSGAAYRPQGPAWPGARMHLQSSAAHSLPEACLSLLEQDQCWLRSAGNERGSVDTALADARFVYENWHETADTCRATARSMAQEFDGVGCGVARPASASLPLAGQASCAAGEYFFVREDGHVSGCARTCTTSDDCDPGQRCSSTGSAARGPVGEFFCE